MYSNHMYPEDHQIDAIHLRHQRAASGASEHAVANVIGRLITWLVLTLATFVAWVYAVMVGFTLTYSEEPPPEPDKLLVTAIPVLFVLSVTALLGPGASRGLRLFGLVWASIVGAMVVSATINLW